MVPCGYGGTVAPPIPLWLEMASGLQISVLLRNLINLGLADLWEDGDGIDDYIWLDPASGAPLVYTNKGPHSADSLGWSWSPLNGGSPLASGVAPAEQVQFGDVDGDGKADYIILDPKTGAMNVYLNGGQVSCLHWMVQSLHILLTFDKSSNATDDWIWEPIGQISSGHGPGSDARIAGE